MSPAPGLESYVRADHHRYPDRLVLVAAARNRQGWRAVRSGHAGVVPDASARWALRAILHHPAVLSAVDPRAGIALLTNGRWAGFLVLGAVFLVVTGGEALYADMGHFGTRPIRVAWFALVLPALLLNYFGQGALLLENHALRRTRSTVWRRAGRSIRWSAWPPLATIIASQAVISGAFSLTRQAAMLGYWPRVAIEHKSEEQIGQIYVPSINWTLMVMTVVLVLAFGSSVESGVGLRYCRHDHDGDHDPACVRRGAPALGLERMGGGGVSASFLVLDLAFFSANLVKVEHGGWFPLAVAAAGFVMLTTWKKGRTLLGRQVRKELMPVERFFGLLAETETLRAPGTAVYMTSNTEGTPAALTRMFEHTHSVHESVILLTVVMEDSARLDDDQRLEVTDLGQGFTRVVAHYGFMEFPDIPRLLSRDDTPTPGIEETSFVLGYETLLPRGHKGMARWRQRVFATMSRNSQPATSFFNVPAERVLEVGSQVEL